MASIALEGDLPSTASQGHVRRSPTLESQRGSGVNPQSILQWLWPPFGFSPSLDDFEQLIDQTTKFKDDEAVADSCRDYRRLKAGQGARISQCLVWYKTFGPFAPCPIDTCECTRSCLGRLDGI